MSERSRTRAWFTGVQGLGRTVKGRIPAFMWKAWPIPKVERKVPYTRKGYAGRIRFEVRPESLVHPNRLLSCGHDWPITVITQLLCQRRSQCGPTREWL